MSKLTFAEQLAAIKGSLNAQPDQPAQPAKSPKADKKPKAKPAKNKQKKPKQTTSGSALANEEQVRLFLEEVKGLLDTPEQLNAKLQEAYSLDGDDAFDLSYHILEAANAYPNAERVKYYLTCAEKAAFETLERQQEKAKETARLKQMQDVAESSAAITAKAVKGKDLTEEAVKVKKTVVLEAPPAYAGLVERTLQGLGLSFDRLDNMFVLVGQRLMQTRAAWGRKKATAEFNKASGNYAVAAVAKQGSTITGWFLEEDAAHVIEKLLKVVTWKV